MECLFVIRSVGMPVCKVVYFVTQSIMSFIVMLVCNIRYFVTLIVMRLAVTLVCVVRYFVTLVCYEDGCDAGL